MTTNFIPQLTALIQRSCMHQQALQAVFKLQLPQCYIAAGFLRNLIWDDLHDKSPPTPLNDCDVVYFAKQEENDHQYRVYEEQLQEAMPMVNWQVRNQARMHIRNHDAPYSSTLDAMAHWVEQETAVGVRLISPEHYEFCSVFGWDSVFAGNITLNPLRDEALFWQRVNNKKWLMHWPKLTPKLTPKLD